MLTPFGEKLDREMPLSEYPRPQLRRESWQCLNGPWEYAIRPTLPEEPFPESWDGSILVPFSPESELSGVGRTLRPAETLWYRRYFALPENWNAGKRLLLHFGAVDQEAAVFVNGQKAWEHRGGYNAFTVDATAFIQPKNELIVRVYDDTDASWHTRGKQRTKRGGIWYTPQSGIWQTVWMEWVPEAYIQRVRLIPDIDRGELELTVFASRPGEGTAVLQGERFAFTVGTPVRLPVRDQRLWSPDDPWLYPLELHFGEDRVESYFAMRKTEVRAGKDGVRRLYLNNRPCFHNGLLDQGYWPDGLYTAPADEAMIFDLQTAKKLGYNMLRKHIKVEPMRWYYHCDRLGLLVWQDMPNGGGKYHFSTISFPLVTGIHHRDNRYRKFARESRQGREEYRAELWEMITQLESVPSIVLWVPFNEGWGQFDAADACRIIRLVDESRPIDHASGWHDQKIGDLQSLHVYFRPYRFRPDKLGRAVILSEFGGYNLRLEGHCWNDVNYGYKGFSDREALWQAYRKLMEEQILPAIPRGLCAAVYTQLTDVEDELNGIMTYDRRVVKLPEETLRQLNRRLLEAGAQMDESKEKEK